MDMKLAAVVDELDWFTFWGKYAGAGRHLALWSDFFEHMFER
jgi:hypothetical protein